MKVVDTEDSFDLCEESSQQPEVSSGHPYEASDYLWEELFIGQCNARGRPAPLKEFLHLIGIQGPKLVDESDARIEPRKSGDTLFDAQHADQHHAGGTLVEDRSR